MKTIERSLFCLIVLAFFVAVPLVLAPSAAVNKTENASPEDDSEFAQELSNSFADLMSRTIMSREANAILQKENQCETLAYVYPRFR